MRRPFVHSGDAVECPTLSKRIATRVEWFDALKGWGIARSSELEGEIVLYHRVVIQSGLSKLTAGTVLICDVVPMPQGHEAVHVVSADAATDT